MTRLTQFCSTQRLWSAPLAVALSLCFLVGCSDETEPDEGVGGTAGQEDPGVGGSGGDGGDPGSGGAGGADGTGGTGGSAGAGDGGDDGSGGEGGVPGSGGEGGTGGSEAVCGNGVVEGDEECDDGLDNDDTKPGACRTNCKKAHCGDDVVDPGEECDEGDFNNDFVAGACRSDCTLPSCGDGVLDPGEQCDNGDENAFAPNACRPDTCTLPACGDGIHDFVTEECDDGEANANAPNACRPGTCKLPFCGDGIIDDLQGEACDDGAANSDTAPDACRTNCQPATCGDGVKDSDEVCDGADLGGRSCGTEGFAKGTLRCAPGCDAVDTSECSGTTTCGDGVVEGAEECDDGNTKDGDGCSSQCKLEASCGNVISLNQEAVQGTSYIDPSLHSPAIFVYEGDLATGKSLHQGSCQEKDSHEELVLALNIPPGKTVMWHRIKPKDQQGPFFSIYARETCEDPKSEIFCSPPLDPAPGQNDSLDKDVIPAGKFTQIYFFLDMDDNWDPDTKFIFEYWLQDFLKEGDPCDPNSIEAVCDMFEDLRCDGGICKKRQICSPKFPCQ